MSSKEGEGGGGTTTIRLIITPFPFFGGRVLQTPLEFFPVTVKFPPWLAESLGMGNVGTSSEHKKIRQLFMDN